MLIEHIENVAFELDGLPFQICICAEATSNLVTVDVIEEHEIELIAVKWHV